MSMFGDSMDLMTSPKRDGPHARGRPYVAIGVVRDDEHGKRVSRVDYSLAQFRRFLNGDKKIGEELRVLLDQAEPR